MPTLAKRPFFTYNTGSFMAESSDTMDMKEFQLHEKDTGSADVQVALLTRRIAQLTGTPQEPRQRSFLAPRPPQDGGDAPELARLSEQVGVRPV